MLGDVPLDNVEMYNYLGVIIDDNLTFDEFLKQKCNKINQRLYQLIKVRKFVILNIANNLYKQAILPLCDYLGFLIDSGTAYYRRKLDNLHEKAIRIIDCNKNRNSDMNVLENLYSISSVDSRRKEYHCTIMYRLSRRGECIDTYRPKIRLRSRKMMKFRSKKRNLEIKMSTF